MAESYDKEQLIELCNQIDLLDYASQTMTFKKVGSDSFATHCPLHIDKTPSLFITHSKNVFHCFSCGVGGGLINWLMTFEKLSFYDSVKKITELTDCDINSLKQCDALKFYSELRDFEVQQETEVQPHRQILSPSEIDRYSTELPIEWVNEGISPTTMKLFNIRIDSGSNRIVYPIYDSSFNLIGFKGRTRYQNYKAMGIQKYMNYQKIGTTDFFVGMKEQYDTINQLKKVIIFEGIKSVMKAYDWGYNYCLAAETSCLNESQVKLLIQMGIKDVTLAFDSDVSINKILTTTDTLRKFTNVYVVKDRLFKGNRLLGEKDSPVDKGKVVFETLLSERKKV